MGILSAADVFAHQIELGDRDIEDIRAGIADLDIILDHTVDIHLLDPLEDADAVGDVDDIVARRDIRDRPDALARLLAAGAADGGPGIAAPAVGDERHPHRPVFEAGRQPRRHHHHLAEHDRGGIGEVVGGDPLAGEVAYERAGSPFGSGEYDTAVAQREIAADILDQGGDIPRPGGELHRVEGDEIFQRKLAELAGEGLHQDDPAPLHPAGVFGEIEVEMVEALEQHPVLKEDFDILLLAAVVVAERLPHLREIRAEQQMLAA